MMSRALLPGGQVACWLAVLLAPLVLSPTEAVGGNSSVCAMSGLTSTAPSSAAATPRRPDLSDPVLRREATERLMRAVGAAAAGAAPGLLADALGQIGFGVTRRDAPGELLVVGTGIRVGQMTLETINAVDAADLVLYSVADTLTEQFLCSRRPDAIDLYPLYGNGKLRDETYTQTAEAMLAPARLGLRVAAVFYGHPGIFDFPSHRAIVVARREGLRASMLPAVSASGNLYADLGVDPSSPGMQTMEATDVLLRRRALDPTMSAIIYQVGGIGDPGFNYSGSANPKFGAFVARLTSVYGAEHKAILYMAHRLPTEKPSVRVHSLAELAAMDAEDVEAKVTGISTMLLPPRDEAPLDDDVLAQPGMEFYRIYEAAGGSACPFGYGPEEREAVSNLTRFSMPSFYEYLEGKDPAARAFLLDLALKPETQAGYLQSPEETMARYGVTRDRVAAYPLGENKTSMHHTTTVHRNQIHRNKIMHHHRVHSYCAYLINGSSSSESGACR